MTSPVVWGLDIGGTKCALVIGNRAGETVDRWQVDTAQFPRWEPLVETLLDKAKHAPRPCAVGVSCGGPLDARRGLILSPPNLPGWDEVPITRWLADRLQVPAYLQNDANACALAEWRFGAGKGCRHMVFLTFGTGMGAGLILNGRLYEGASGMAGEVGHMRLAENGPVGYGKAGSFEGFCSGGGIRQLAQAHMGRDLSARELVALAETGDQEAIRVLTICAGYLGRGISVIIDLFNPERIVIGSIYARSGKWFEETMWAVITSEALALSHGAVTIVPALLGDRIGDAAALTTAWNGLEEETV